MSSFKTGDMVIYKQTGVCRILEIAPSKYLKSKELYYTLKPLYAQGMVYVPVNTSAYLRRVMDKKEAENWILKMPEIKENICTDRRLAVQKEFYSQLISRHNFEDLIGMIKGLYQKSKKMQPGKKALTSTEELFMKQAEDLVFQELAAALDEDIKSIPEIIEKQSDGE